MKLLLSVLGILVLLAAVISYNVWHAFSEPVISEPGPVELGRQQLHAQLEAAKNREAQFEKQDWDYITPLHNLILAHQQRIDKLAGNKEAAEIVAYDREAITRIQKRINEIDAKQKQEWLEKQQSPAQTAPPGQSPTPQQ